MAKKPLTKNLVEAAEPRLAGSEIGESGTLNFQGLISQDYNPKLRDVQAIKIYDEMRLSDGTVQATVRACTLPIRHANWYVQAASEDAQDVEIKDFIEKALFDLQTITWEDILRHALLSVVFGVMVFEKVFAVQDVDGKTRIIWKKLAPRLPQSIQRWQMSDGGEGIEQRLTQGGLANIPMEKLLVFVNEKEGDNWWGTSILRAAYKHWFFKDSFYRIDSIAFERQGLGVPFAKHPTGAVKKDIDRIELILKNMRAHQQAWVSYPEGYEVGFLDMKAGTLRDPKESIMHHNREIVKSVLAQFLELGATDSGSRALSTDQTELFLQSMESVAKGIADVFNTYAIKQLVDLNFDNVQDYPYLAFNGISATDVTALSAAYSSLITAGGIKAGEGDEEFFREILGLPERDTSNDPVVDPNAEEPDTTGLDDAGKPADDKQKNDQTMKDIGMQEHAEGVKKKSFPERKQIASAIKKAINEKQAGEAMAFLTRSVAMIKIAPLAKTNRAFSSLLVSEYTKALATLRRDFDDEATPYKSFRKLTFAEQKVDFQALERTMDKLEESLDASTRSILNAERAIFMDKLSSALSRGDKDAVKNAVFKIKNDYAKVLKDHMKTAFEAGKTQAGKEIGIGNKTPATSREILAQIDIQANAIADLHIAQIQNEAKTKMVEALNKGASNAMAIAAADGAVASLIDELTADTSSIAMAGYINNGRNFVVGDNLDKIYALQRSEILDSATCNYCLSIDGRVVEKDDPFAQNTIFHSGCRGIWVAIMLDEEELPTIGGIPSSIRDRFGDAVNDLIQPKNPIVKKDSLARKEAERRARRKAGK